MSSCWLGIPQKIEKHTRQKTTHRVRHPIDYRTKEISHPRLSPKTMKEEE
jgi:hypothetical protein